MSNKAIDRMAWLKAKYSDIKVLSTYDDMYFTEFVVDRNGDTLTFRVYGNKPEEMYETEK